ncbi:MAG: AI-2E family transporter [Chloroflexaceae bacterium]|nr:AI-2E family transporter [Chloroflexaceae bacterium]
MTTLLGGLPFRRIARWGLVALSLYGIGWLLWQARSALLPFVIGALLAYLFLPLVNRFGRRMPRWAAILLVYALVLLVIVTFFAFLVPPLVEQISQLIRALPDLPTLERWANRLLEEYQQLLANLPPNVQTEVQQTVAEVLTSALNTIRTNLLSYIQGIGTFLVGSLLSVASTVAFLLGFFLVPFWLFYVLMDQQAGRDTLNRLLPAGLRADFWSVITIIDADFSGYLRGQLLLGLAVGTAAGIGLAVLNLFGLSVPYVLLLAVIAGVTELIPIIGPIIGAVPAVLLGFLDSPTTGLAVLLLYVGIQQLENNFLVPRIVGDSVGLHPAILMVLLVVCSQVFGVLGAILSAPMGAVSRDVFQYLYGRLSEPPRPPGEMPVRLRAAGVAPPPEALGLSAVDAPAVASTSAEEESVTVERGE